MKLIEEIRPFPPSPQYYDGYPGLPNQNSFNIVNGGEMSAKTYRLTFEVVSAIGPGAQFYRGEQPNCKPGDVPDEFWHTVERLDSDPWDQYRTLKKWAETGEQLIRNVRLYSAPVPSVEWEEVAV